ncbi:DUF4118 domain-containing protein [Rhizosaccharibacter radicis]|uniref:histidine kinase n=1 Tax=Rhizosaccharibacter radicis TaxID=2782605 RepID=A0ABT1VYT5_9PROT|nr:sensor histidine kinase KdpD [Acetobacteraceae bacterium KSS12]
MADSRSDDRPDPDALLAASIRETAGRLKIFLGAAPGVGKTWKMLNQARAAQTGGIDVLAGVIETHGRSETAAQLEGIPVLPMRQVPHGGQMLEEFDLDGALARRPALLLVDELAHTNAPGSRHGKRWEDVQELVRQGLNVWTTLNIQHIESLNEDVARITGVRVRETLPDQVLEDADEIELIDLPPSDLRTRLRDGKIYRPDTARRALDGYFKEGNLAALREIALRRAAAHVDDDVRGWMRDNRIAGPWPASDRVMAVVGPDEAGEPVVRYAKQLADALRAPWVALLVEPPHLPPRRRNFMPLAGRLGAELETRTGRDLSRLALELAASRNVTQIVVGRVDPEGRRRWTAPFRPSLAARLLRRAGPFGLHVVPSEAAPRPRRRIEFQRDRMAWAGVFLLPPLVTLGGLRLRELIGGEAIGMVFLAVVVATATRGGLLSALCCAALAFLCWDFFFIPPVHTITIANTHDAVSLSVFLLVAGVTGTLAGRVRAEARAGQARVDSLRRIASFSRSFGAAATEPELLAEMARQAAAVVGTAAVLGAGDPSEGGSAAGELHILVSVPPDADLDERSRAAARWSAMHAVEAGRGTTTLPSAGWRFVPVKVRGDGPRIVLGVREDAEGERAALDDTAVQVIDTLADQAATALDRLRLAAGAARASALEDTQKLRTALLNSLSHDLRTPLTGIRGAAETLRASWDALSAEDRWDLLSSVEDDTARMTRFLANIMDLTRLESGQIVARRETVELSHVVEAAIARVPGALHTTVSIPFLLLQADGALLEQVIVNLLDNAVKYSPAGAQIAIRAERRDEEAVIEVADEGIGVSASELPHLFDSFFRARHGDRVLPGTGLGLAIARGLVEAMEGTITAVSPRPDVARDAAPGMVMTIRLKLASEDTLSPRISA